MGKMLENLTAMSDVDMAKLSGIELDKMKKEIAENISNHIETIKVSKNDNREIGDEEIGNHIGLSRSRLNQWKKQSDDGATDTLLTIMRLAKYCGCSVDELLYGELYTKKEQQLIKAEALTDKSVRTIRKYTPKHKLNSLFTGKKVEPKPNYNRLLNYIVCKRKDTAIEVDGYVGDAKSNTLYLILKRVDKILDKLKDIKNKNDKFAGMTYQQLKEDTKLKEIINKELDNLPDIIEMYIEDEFDDKVDCIIGSEIHNKKL